MRWVEWIDEPDDDRTAIAGALVVCLAVLALRAVVRTAFARLDEGDQ